MRIGILGGSFNPIHYGHLEMALHAKEEFHLDKVLLMVAATPPHKQKPKRISAEYRLQMVNAALTDTRYDGIFTSDDEIKRGGVSYTADTVTILHDENPTDELFLIMGADMLTTFNSWYLPEKICSFANIIALKRPSQEEDFRYDQSVAYIRDELSGNIFTSEYIAPDISSTDIRDRVFNARPIAGLVPYAVERFIYEHALYSPPDVHYITLDLQKRLSPKRFVHSVSTMREAILLADKFNADRNRCRLAGLTHDCEKVAGVDSIEQAQKYGIQIDDFERNAPGLIHAKLGSHMVKMRYGIRDKIISDAINCHTLAAPRMTDVAMITYLADCTEAMRVYDGVDGIRNATAESLKSGMLAAINMSENMLKEQNKPMHPQTIEAKKWLIETLDSI